MAPLSRECPNGRLRRRSVSLAEPLCPATLLVCRLRTSPRNWTRLGRAGGASPSTECSTLAQPLRAGARMAAECARCPRTAAQRGTAPASTPRTWTGQIASKQPKIDAPPPMRAHHAPVRKERATSDMPASYALPAERAATSGSGPTRTPSIWSPSCSPGAGRIAEGAARATSTLPSVVSLA